MLPTVPHNTSSILLRCQFRKMEKLLWCPIWELIFTLLPRIVSTQLTQKHRMLKNMFVMQSWVHSVQIPSKNYKFLLLVFFIKSNFFQINLKCINHYAIHNYSSRKKPNPLKLRNTMNHIKTIYLKTFFSTFCVKNAHNAGPIPNCRRHT